MLDPHHELRAFALDAIDQAALAFDSDGKVLLANRQFRQVFGSQPGKGGLHIWAEKVRLLLSDGHTPCPPAATPWDKALAGEELRDVRYALPAKGHKRVVWLSATSGSFKDPAVASAYFLLFFRDITETVSMERALDSARRMRQLLFEENRAAIVQTTVDGRVLAGNQALARLLGYDSPSEVSSVRAGDAHISGARERMLQALMKTGVLTDYEMELRRRDGSTAVVIANLRLLPPEQAGGETSIITTLIDISERRRAEIGRAEIKRRFDQFMRYLPDVAFIKDRSGRYIFVSESCRTKAGLDPAFLIGKSDDQLWPRRLAEQFRRHDEEVFVTGQPVRHSTQVPTHGESRSWSIYKFPIPGEAGQLLLLGGLAVDESERKSLEARLREAEKMEAIGRLAGGIAHDFNNLLTVIAGYGQMLQDAISREVDHDKLATYTDDLLSASRRATGLTDQLLSFSRRKVVKPRRLDLGGQIREMKRMLAPLLGERIELEIEASGECLISADPGEIERVIMNLALNARDAMPDGGRLYLRTHLVDDPPGEVPPPSVVLECEDTGVGMDGATRSHIFEPFFTLKPRGRGTGLGLSTVYGIVKQSGGEIVVKSEPGAGSKFKIYFPALPSEPASPKQTAAAAPAIPRELAGSETILLVEDDLNVRSLVNAALVRFGYRVLAAGSGAEALKIFDESKDEIQLLLTDIVMPHISGRRLAAELRRTRPSLLVLYMSGYLGDEVTLDDPADSGALLLPKPFTPEVLAQYVRQSLEPPAAKSSDSV